MPTRRFPAKVDARPEAALPGATAPSPTPAPTPGRDPAARRAGDGAADPRIAARALARASRVAVLLGLALVAASPWLPHLGDGPAGWLLDLARHWQWCVVPTALALALAARHARATASVAALVAVASGVHLATAHVPLDAVRPDALVLRLVQANVKVTNRDPAALLAWLATVSPDVVVLEEVPPDWTGALERLADHPHRAIHPRADGFGLAVLSRHPLADVRLVGEAGGPPRLEATLAWSGREITLVAVHPMPPFTPRWHALRDATLDAAGARVAGLGRPGLVVGDLNATPWSSGVAALERHRLRLLTGIAPTWNAVLGPLAPLPIDHVAATAHWAVVGRERGPAAGSDHRPLQLDLQPR